MSNIKTVVVNNTTYDIEDAQARSLISSLSENVYSKEEITSALSSKADKSDVPTALSSLSTDENHRTVSDTEKATWNAKSDFSGSYNDLKDKPSIPSIDGLATVSQVNTAEDNANDYTDQKIADLINGAPSTLDTLKEIADAMAEDKKVVEALDEAIGTKVDKVSGKGLSTNDFTASYKSAIDNLPTSYAPVDAQKNVQSDWNATSGDAFIKNKPTIPSAVTESTVSGWGFTKNTGSYSKPSGGIPKTDLASAVQTSLGKADTALQSVPAVSTSVAGLCPKLDGSTSKYLRADGTWQTVQGGSSVVYTETKPTGQSNGCVWIASANV